MGGEWITFVTKSNHPFAYNMIAEFQPANLREYSTGLLLLALMTLATLALQSRALHGEACKIIALCIFVAGGLMVVKFIPFAAIFTGSLLARSWQSARIARGELAVALEQLGEQLVRPATILALSPLLILQISCALYILHRSPVDNSLLPTRAVDFIVDRNLPHPILNDFGHGGYLIYRFSDRDGNPIEKVAIDGRTNLISHELWQANVAALRGSKNWRKFFEIVKPRTVLWWSDSPLTSLLLERDDWCRVFQSEKGEYGHSVFVTRSYFEAHRKTLESDNCQKS
jgi:hypothetical protein